MDSPINENEVPGQETTECNIFISPQVLFSFSKENKIILEKGTLDQIKCIKESIIVIGVMGKYRTGKSWIINRMLELKQGEKGFHVEYGQATVTIGVLALCRKHPTRENSVVMFLDTEGLNAVGKPQKFVGHIFHYPNGELDKTYALYVPSHGRRRHGRQRSSYLSHIQLLLGNEEITFDPAHITIWIKIAVNEGRLWSPAPLPNYGVDYKKEMWGNFVSKIIETLTPTESIEALPQFILLVRDVSTFKMNGKVMSAEEYLDKILTNTGIDDLDKIRTAIRNVFHSRLCYALPCPVEKVADVDDINDCLITVDYLKNEEEFKKRLFAIEPKKILSLIEMNGQKLSVLIENYSNAIAKNGVPHVPSAFECIEEIYIKEMHQNAFEEYKGQLNNIADKASIKREHEQVSVQVKEDFRSKISNVNDSRKTKYVQLLDQDIMREYERKSQELDLKDKDRTIRRLKLAVACSMVVLGTLGGASTLGVPVMTGAVGKGVVAAAITGGHFAVAAAIIGGKAVVQGAVTGGKAVVQGAVTVAGNFGVQRMEAARDVKKIERYFSAQETCKHKQTAEGSKCSCRDCKKDASN